MLILYFEEVISVILVTYGEFASRWSLLHMVPRIQHRNIVPRCCDANATHGNLSLEHRAAHLYVTMLL